MSRAWTASLDATPPCERMFAKKPEARMARVSYLRQLRVEPGLGAAEGEAVDGGQEGFRRRFERVGGDAAAALLLAGMLQFNGHFRLGILADRHRLHAEVAADRRDAGQLFDRQKDAVYRAVAGGDRHRLGSPVVEDPQRDRGR